MNKKTDLIPVSLFGAFVIALFLISPFGGSASALITRDLEFGDRGTDVTELQRYLATRQNLYPEALVTGYFGPLTQTAVQRFQVAQGLISATTSTTGTTTDTTSTTSGTSTETSTGSGTITSEIPLAEFGRVGPLTRARLNTLIAAAGMSTVTTETMGDKGGPTATPSPVSPMVPMPSYTTSDPAPVLGTPVVEVTNSTATITWSTNEPAIGILYHDDESLVFGPSMGPRLFPYVSGNLVVLDDGALGTEHSITLENLESDTVYYYSVGAMDSIANTTLGGANSFRTEE